MKRGISLFVTLALVVGMMHGFSMEAFAGYVKAYQISIDNVTNPMTEDLWEEESEETVEKIEKIEVNASTVKAASNSFSDEISVSKYIRNQMVKRENSIEFTYTGDYLDELVADFGTYLNMFVSNAMSEDLAEDNYQGDYLLWIYHGYSAEMSYSISTNFFTGTQTIVSATITITMQYNTTADEEEVVQNFVTDNCENYDLYGSDLTPLQKLVRIHDLVCQTTTYDYDAAEDGATVQDFLKSYTAYGAVANGTCVCQGYALLTYALCREAGIPVRFIASLYHGWNLVSIDGGKTYYNLDCTWDDTGDRWGVHTYFLKSDSDMQKGNGSHNRKEDYLTSEFMAEYSVPKTSYVRYECFEDGHIGYDPYNDSLLVPYTSHSYSEDVCSVCGYSHQAVETTTIIVTTEATTTAEPTTLAPTTLEPTTAEPETESDAISETEYQGLKTPEGFEYAGNELLLYHFAWQYVEGAEYYNVYINGTLYERTVELCIDVDPGFFTYVGEYLFEVSAVAGDEESEKAVLRYSLNEIPTTTEAPTTEEVTTEETTVEPTTLAPTTEEPTTAEPPTEVTTAEPTTVEPTTERPTAEPTTAEPTTLVPTTEVPTTTEETTTEEYDIDFPEIDIDDWDDEDWDDEEELETTPPKKPTISNVKRKSAKKIAITIKKVSGAKGYQVQVSKKKKFKKVIFKKYIRKTKTVIKSSKFKKIKTLFVRSRSYKKVDDVAIFSKWSKVVKVKK